MTVVALVVPLAAGCGGDGRPSSGRERAQAACRRFVAEIEPYRVGVGLAELADQAKGFRVARARLAEKLHQAAQSDHNTRGLTSLADELLEGNRLLAEAEQIARELAQGGGDPNNPSLITTLKAFERAAKREDAHAIDLGLLECADRPHR